MSDLENPKKPKIILENRNDTTLKSSGHEVGDKAMPFLLFRKCSVNTVLCTQLSIMTTAPA